MDRSWRSSSSQAGVGGVLRDHSSRILYLFSAKVGVQDAISAEILAIAKAIELCISNPEVANKIIFISSDLREAVSSVNGSSFDRYDCKCLTFDWRILLAKS